MRSLWASIWILGGGMVLALSQFSEEKAQKAALGQSAVASSAQHQAIRNQMLQTLEDLIQRERFFRRRSGSFTAVLGKLEFDVPGSIRGQVEVRVTAADREHVMVEAFRESEGMTDRIWMDEQFRVQANFPMNGLRWVVLNAARTTASAASDWGADSTLPELEVEPVSSTASSNETLAD